MFSTLGSDTVWFCTAFSGVYSFVVGGRRYGKFLLAGSSRRRFLLGSRIDPLLSGAKGGLRFFGRSLLSSWVMCFGLRVMCFGWRVMCFGWRVRWFLGDGPPTRGGRCRHRRGLFPPPCQKSAKSTDFTGKDAFYQTPQSVPSLSKYSESLFEPCQWVGATLNGREDPSRDAG